MTPEQQERKARDWPGDAGHENGNYCNRCCFCKEWFTGYKRRHICRSCDTPQKEIEIIKDAGILMPNPSGDYSGGNYQCKCGYCKKWYQGLKRSHACRKCYDTKGLPDKLLAKTRKNTTFRPMQFKTEAEMVD